MSPTRTNSRTLVAAVFSVASLTLAACTSGGGSDSSGLAGGAGMAGTPATGGSSAGGSAGTGGHAATGGSPATGGHSTTGGSSATGGKSGTGGNTATGGSATGGNSGSGGSAGTGGSGTEPTPVGISGAWTLAFSDEFSGTAIDTTKWRIMGTGDPVYWGSQAWRAADSYLDGTGNLVTRLTTASGPLTGGAIYSKWKMSKGYFEARIKHEGGWFAWWIESPRMGSTSGHEDPAVYGTEMDICEADAWANVMDKQHAVHWDGYGQYHQTQSASTGISDANWHVYGFLWTDTAYDFYVDGKQTWHFTAAISQTSDQDMIINNASYQNRQSNGIAYVDYVRYWTPR